MPARADHIDDAPLQCNNVLIKCSNPGNKSHWNGHGLIVTYYQY